MTPRDEIDDNLLAAYAEGRLFGAGRQRVEAHLAVDDEARAIAAAMAADREATHADAGGGGAPAARVPILWRVIPLAAAVLLVALVPAWLGRRGPTGSTASALDSAAAALEAKAPLLFAGFRPYDRATLATATPDVLRGGIAVRWPRGTDLEGHPTVDWRPVSGADEYEVTILTADGRTVHSRREPRPGAAAAPPDAPLAPGEYVVEVAAKASLGRVEGRRAFTVASPELRATWKRALEVVAVETPRDLADLVAAHAAPRRGLVWEAWLLARRHAKAHPDDADGAALLAYLERGGDGS